MASRGCCGWLEVGVGGAMREGRRRVGKLYKAAGQ